MHLVGIGYVDSIFVAVLMDEEKVNLEFSNLSIES